MRRRAPRLQAVRDFAAAQRLAREQAEEAQDAPLLEAYKEVMAQNPHGKADNVMRVRLPRMR